MGWPASCREGRKGGRFVSCRVVVVFGRPGAGNVGDGDGFAGRSGSGARCGRGRPENGGRCRSGTDALNVDELYIDEVGGAFGLFEAQAEA